MTLRHAPIRLRRSRCGEPLVMQCTIGQFQLTYNPDDERFYVVNADDETVATFAGNNKGWTNALAAARRRITNG